MDNEHILTSDGELMHWGIKGMRWGVRRYQTKNGALTPAGKKRYDKDMEKVKAETKRLKDQERTNKKLAKLEDAKSELAALKGKGKKIESKNDDETDEQKRDRILKSPSPKEVYENRHLFSNKEIQDLSLRLNNESSIKNLATKDLEEKTNKALEKIGKLTTGATELIKMYNTVANIVNAAKPLDRSMMPKIDTNITNGNRQQRRQEAGIGNKKKDKDDD